VLALDFERAVGDSLRDDHNFAWYRRCFYRRLHATEQIVKSCLALTRCEWLQYCIDSEGNDDWHQFVVVEEREGAQSIRVVKPIMQWWMVEHFKGLHMGDLPSDMVKENAYWETWHQ
jgi:hypothetical protein